MVRVESQEAQKLIHSSYNDSVQARSYDSPMNGLGERMGDGPMNGQAERMGISQYRGPQRHFTERGSKIFQTYLLNHRRQLWKITV